MYTAPCGLEQVYTFSMITGCHIYIYIFFFGKNLTSAIGDVYSATKMAHVSMRRELLGQDYHIETIITKPSDLGFGCISRLRIYLLLIHKKYGRFVGSPQDLYSRITDKLQGNTAMTIDSAFWESDVSQLRSELLDSMTKTRISNLDATGGDAVSSAVNTDWSSFLTDWETKCLSTYQSMWVDRHESLANAVFVLNQNPEFHKSWTSIGSNGQVALPTLPLCLKWCSFYFPV